MDGGAAAEEGVAMTWGAWGDCVGLDGVPELGGVATRSREWAGKRRDGICSAEWVNTVPAMRRAG